MIKTGTKKVVALAAIVAVMASAFKQDGGYRITGNFKGLPDGTRIELIPGGTHDQEKPVAVTTVKGGRFVFTGNVSSPRMFFIKLASEQYTLFPVMVENAAITATGVVEAQKEGDKVTHQFKNLAIEGSQVHKEFLEKTSLRNRMEVLYTAYNEANKEVSAQMGKARQSKDTTLIKKIEASDAWKKLEKEEGEFFKTVTDSTNALILANKDTWWGPFLMLQQMSYFTKEQQPMFNAMSDAAKQSYYGQVVQKELYPPSLVGKAAPSLQFVNAKQQPVAFAAIAKDKKYVLVDFWASWCAPCRRAIPGLKEFYSTAKAQGVEIVSVSIDSKEADWVKANTQEKFPWHSFLDKKDVSKAFGVKAIPAMFLLDNQGNVVAENVSLEEVKEKLK